MSVVRTHHYTVDPADLDELLRRRGSLIDTIRASHPGLSATFLIRLEDGSYADTWHWENAEQLAVAIDAIPTFAGVSATMALTSRRSAQNGRVVDEH